MVKEEKSYIFALVELLHPHPMSMTSSLSLILPIIVFGICVLVYYLIKTNTKKDSITKLQYQNIIRLLKALEKAGSASEKKKIRQELRELGYYISVHKANTVDGFKQLINNGIIIVKDDTTSSVKISKTLSNVKSKASRKEVYSFPPIVDDSSEILILGTAPGNNSLATEEYYAQSGNLFWTIIQQLYNDGIAFSSYEEKVNCLKANHIALWDTLKACDRKGSTDGEIVNEEKNDIDKFLKQHSSIKKIVFNGQRPSSYYVPSIPYEIALSTSPSNRQYSDEIRINSWKKCLCSY